LLIHAVCGATVEKTCSAGGDDVAHQHAAAHRVDLPFGVLHVVIERGQSQRDDPLFQPLRAGRLDPLQPGGGRFQIIAMRRCDGGLARLPLVFVLRGGVPQGAKAALGFFELAEVMPMLPPTRQALCHRLFSNAPQRFPQRLEIRGLFLRVFGRLLSGWSK
jgi:hypothetical protein